MIECWDPRCGYDDTHTHGNQCTTDCPCGVGRANADGTPYEPDDEDEAEQGGCPFCARITDHQREWDDVVDFEPLNPVTPGHRLFVSAEHYEHPSPNMLGLVMYEAAEYAKDQGGDYNLITSSGLAATQTVAHIHVHYLPRREGDGLPLPWTGQSERGTVHRRVLDHDDIAYCLDCTATTGTPAQWPCEPVRALAEMGG